MDNDRQIELHWPMAGVDRRYGWNRQPPYSTPFARNVRPDSAEGKRERGGSRPGMVKFYAQPLGGMTKIQMLESIDYLSSNALVTRTVAVSAGNVYVESTAGSLSLLGAGGQVSATKILQSSVIDQKMYIADYDSDPAVSSAARAPKVYSPVAGTFATLTATAGTIPYGCPITCEWRSRLLFAGGTTEPYGIFASKQNDATNWDYSETGSGAAWSMAATENGKIGEPVTAMHAFSDLCLIIGCTTSLWILRGDPTFGGALDNLSDCIGVIDKNACCRTPDGLFVFLSHDGLYAIPAGCDSARHPQSLSRERLPDEMRNINVANYAVSLAYDVSGRGIHIFITPHTAGAASHWWFDWETKSFWEVTLDEDHQPFCAHPKRNFPSSESEVLLGCRDGYVRRFHTGYDDDDGVEFESLLWIGPFGDPSQMSDTLISKMQVTLGASSGDVDFSLITGNSPQQAYQDGEAQYTGVFDAGHGGVHHPRVRATASFMTMSGRNNVGWTWEGGSMIVSGKGRARPK